jgi:hypothetical protein
MCMTACETVQLLTRHFELLIAPGRLFTRSMVSTQRQKERIQCEYVEEVPVLVLSLTSKIVLQYNLYTVRE